MQRLKAFIHEWKDVEFLAVAILGVFSLYLTAYGLRLSHEWEKQKFTATLLKEWNNDVEKYKNEIFKAYPKLADGISASKGGIPESVGLRLDSAYAEYSKRLHNGECTPSLKPSPPECSELLEEAQLRDAVVGILNYLEYVSVAYEQDVVVRQKIEEVFWGNFLNWFGATVEYIKASNPTRLLYWAPYIKVACGWHRRSSLEETADASKRITEACEHLLSLPTPPD